MTRVPFLCITVRLFGERRGDGDGDLLIGERDTGEIAQVLDFFTCECRHGLNYMSCM